MQFPAVFFNSNGNSDRYLQVRTYSSIASFQTRSCLNPLFIFFLSITPFSHYSITPFFHYSIILLFHYPIIPLCHYPNSPLFHYPNSPLHHYSITPLFQFLSVPDSVKLGGYIFCLKVKAQRLKYVGNSRTNK